MLPLLYSLNTHNMEDCNTQPTITTEIGLSLVTHITIGYQYTYNYGDNEMSNPRAITQEVAVAWLN